MFSGPGWIVDAAIESLVRRNCQLCRHWSARRVNYRAWNYKRKYMTKDRFDNTYITPLIWRIEYKRWQKEMETIMPLNFKEQFKYFKMSMYENQRLQSILWQFMFGVEFACWNLTNVGPRTLYMEGILVLVESAKVLRIFFQLRANWQRESGSRWCQDS